MAKLLKCWIAGGVLATACAQTSPAAPAFAAPASKYAVVVSEETLESAKWSAVVDALKAKYGASVFVYEDRCDEVRTDNPKLYYSPGNCYIGHASHKDCMALAWIHNGANQFFGHIVPQGRPCYAWNIADNFILMRLWVEKDPPLRNGDRRKVVVTAELCE